MRDGVRVLSFARAESGETFMLINCVAYQEGKKLPDIKPEDIARCLSQPGSFVWLALKDPGPGELAGVELKIGEVDLFIGRNYVLSVRNHAEPGFAGVRARCEREPELLKHGAGFVFYALIDALESELERVEERIFSGGSARANIEALYALKQKLMTLKHAVEPLLEAVGKLYGARVPQICMGTQEYFRDVYDHLIRVNQSIDSLRDMVTTAINVNLSLVTVQENETTKRLAACAALVAVPTMMAGIYGMNFEHMPELKWVFGYPVAVGAMAAIDGYLFYRFRKAGWL